LQKREKGIPMAKCVVLSDWRYMKRCAMVMILCGVSYLCADPGVSINSLVASIKQGQGVTFFDLPGMKNLKLPIPVPSFLRSFVIDPASVTVDNDGSLYAEQDIVWGKFFIHVQIRVLPSLETSIDILLPDDFALPELLPALQKLSLFSCKSMHLIVVTSAHENEIDSYRLEAGANFVGSIGFDGVLRNLATMVGTTIEHITVCGCITPNFVGSSFSAILPVQLNFGGVLTAINPRFVIEIEPLKTKKVPLFLLKAAVTLLLPEQLPVTFETVIEFYKKKARLTGFFDGVIKNIFGVYGLHAGNWELGAGINYAALASAVSVGGFIPLTDFIVGFELDFRQRLIKMISVFDLETLANGGGIAFEGEWDDGLTLDECLNVVGEIIEETPHIEQGLQEFRETVQNTIPNFFLEKIHVMCSSQDVAIVGHTFTKGLIIDGYGHMFGVNARLLLDIQERGFKILGTLEKIQWGPIVLTGPGIDHIMNTPDDGPVIDAELTLDRQCCFLASGINIDIFGGISDVVKIDISFSHVAFELNKKLMNIFDCGLIFSGALDKNFYLVDAFVQGYMHQTALTELQNMLATVGHDMAKTKMAWYRNNKTSLSDVVHNVYTEFWQALANLVGNTFNITEFTFEEKLNLLIGKTMLPKVTVKGVVLGKKFEIRDFSFDLNKPFASVAQLVELASQLF
jgi:hypothetical protein